MPSLYRMHCRLKDSEGIKELNPQTKEVRKMGQRDDKRIVEDLVIAMREKLEELDMEGFISQDESERFEKLIDNTEKLFNLFY